jgi:hypothetical protein
LRGRGKSLRLYFKPVEVDYVNALWIEEVTLWRRRACPNNARESINWTKCVMISKTSACELEFRPRLY